MVVGELLESKSSQQAHMNAPKSYARVTSGNLDSEASQATGGYTIGFSMTVLQVLDFVFNFWLLMFSHLC